MVLVTISMAVAVAMGNYKRAQRPVANLQRTNPDTSLQQRRGEHGPPDSGGGTRLGQPPARRWQIVSCQRGLQRLRRKELELLAYLYRSGAAPMDRQQLLKAAWQRTNVIIPTVDQTVATLRRKLDGDPAKPRHTS